MKKKVIKKSSVKLGDPIQIESNLILKDKSKHYSPDVEIILDDLLKDVYSDLE